MNVRVRRLLVVVLALVGVGVWLVMNPASYDSVFVATENDGADYEVGGAEREKVLGDGADLDSDSDSEVSAPLATEVLERLEVKGRAPKTGYARDQFYGGWPTVDGCSLRQRIIKRDFGDSAVLEGCNVVAGEYDEPYTGEHVKFDAREQISKGVQIDHVVALSDAWQKGAQYLEASVRYEIATDPLNLLAVDSSANQGKSDGDAATWLPPNKKFRCQYVARQVSVKYKYGMWVTSAEKEAILQVLTVCPRERAVGVEI